MSLLWPLGMTRNRVLIAFLLFALCIWVAGAGFSLLKTLNSLPDLTPLEVSPAQQATEPVSSSTISPLVTQAAPAVSAPEVQFPSVVQVAERTVDTPILPREELANVSIEEVVVKVGVSEQDRCGEFDNFGLLRNGYMLIADSQRSHLSHAQHAMVIDSLDDGFVHFLYAQQLGYKVGIGDPLFESVEEHYIKAARGHNRAAAEILAVTYYAVDRVRSRAWWRIVEEMGGRGLQARSFSERFTYSDQEHSDGKDFAETLMNEYRLGPGLGKPEECLSSDEVIAQRSRLADLFRRLASRALPSEAPEGPVVFNRLNGRDLVVENVCSVNCPLDTQRVIYLANDPQDGRDCAQANGFDRTILARSSAGLQERTFCVPVLFAEP